MELVHKLHFLHDFWKKLFLTLYSINWKNFTVQLPLLFQISGNIFIVTVSFPVSYVINFEIYVTFPIKLFPAWPKKSEQKFKYLKYLIFHHFQRAFIERNKINFFGNWGSNFNYKATYNGRKTLYINNHCPQAP